ncbi:isocitrate lyase/PEP mutase family protein [Pelagibius litoralis]|uniref:Isocitrate lyase/PEP mutase family protein n=1 Tax=Pelagibius litoralis TaxID=374515 RepID=A0A967EV81_9PROT|nr:isocitrate lyase/PEP mutase family protein [Pelagibius litoralis]NIA68271.1 isocitrate lyase/PEP mutase family protein [Pelagibius litoralis]
MRWSERRARFRALFAGDRCVHPGSVYDPLSARIAEDLGFEVGMFAGSVASLAVLGAPDLIVLTLSEFAEQAYRINRATNLPLMVDADHGYGNALNVRRTVEELETAGVAGLSIEDTLLPPPFGGAGQAQLISIEEGVGKMSAALAGRSDPNLLIAGRTSALSLSGVDDAVHRIAAYEATGVDAIFLIGVKTKDQLATLRKAVKLPLILGGAAPEVQNLDYLSSMGVRLSLQGHQPFMAAVQAVYDTLKALREGAAPADLEGVAPPALMKRLGREADYQAAIKEFLGGA